MLELREKARHYKTRATEGNYFSREYLAQLDAELEQLYEEQSKNSRNERNAGRADAGSWSRNKPRSPGNEDASRRHAAGELARPHVKRAWGSEESGENIEDGKRVYRDLNEQFKDVAQDSESCSSHSEHDSVHGSDVRDAKKYSTKQSFKKTVNQKHLPEHSRHDNKVPDKNNNRTKPSLSQKHWNETTKPGQTIRRNTPLLYDEPNYSDHSEPVSKHDTKKNRPKTVLNQKHSPKFHEKPPQTVRRDAQLWADVSTSNSEDSSLRSEPHTKTNETKPSLSKTVKQKPSPAFHGIPKPKQTVGGDRALLRNISSGSDASSELSEETGTVSGDNNLDKFNIKYVQGMYSNDHEAPGTSVRSNYDSKSSRKSGYDSDLSQFSLASRESVARQTLAHAKQRKENFW